MFILLVLLIPMVMQMFSFIILYLFYNFAWFCAYFSNYTLLYARGCQLILLEILLVLEMVFGISIVKST